MQKILLILFFSLTTAASSFSQEANYDSLITELNAAKEDSVKVKLYRKVGNSIAYQDTRKAIGYWMQGALLAKKINYKAGAGSCYLNVSTGYSFLGHVDSSLLYMDTAFIYIREAGSTDNIALFFLNRADTYVQLRDFKNALKDCDTATFYAEKIENKDRLARIYHLRSNIYSYQKRYKSSLEYLNRARNIYEQLGNIQMIGQVFSDMAEDYRNTEENEKSVFYYNKAIHIADSIQDNNNMASYCSSLSEVYIALNRLADAEDFANRALRYAKAQGNPVQEALAYSVLSKLYTKQNRIPEAITAGLAGYNMSMNEMYLPLQQESADILALAFSKSGNYEKAYQYMQISKKLNDSLVTKKFNEETAGLQTSFDVTQKEKQIELLGKDKIIQQQRLKRQQVLLMASLAVALLALAGIWLAINRYRLRQHMKELELRNQIAADLHDEVGSSLSSIHMLSQIATQQPGSETSHKDILERMSVNAKETMDKMGDIVWMIKPGESEETSLKQRMERFAYEICSSRNIDTLIELDELEKGKLSMEQRKIYTSFLKKP